jgi:hypothetical protein
MYHWPLTPHSQACCDGENYSGSLDARCFEVQETYKTVMVVHQSTSNVEGYTHSQLLSFNCTVAVAVAVKIEVAVAVKISVAVAVKIVLQFRQIAYLAQGCHSEVL